jgi:hypothetical protein
MPRPINLRLLQAALDKAEQQRLVAEAQREREDDFRMCMGLVGDAAAEGIHKGGRILRVNPTAHPSDAGRKPLPSPAGEVADKGRKWFGI